MTIDFNFRPQKPDEFTHERCECRESEIRRMTTSNGKYQMKRQCLTCGRSVGYALPLTALEWRPADYPEWDRDLSDRYWKAFQDRRNQVANQKNQAFWNWYNWYLTTQAWQIRREKVMERANGICEACQEVEAAQVHHTTYQHVGAEPLWDLRAVCTPCHDRIHSYRKPWESET